MKTENLEPDDYHLFSGIFASKTAKKQKRSNAEISLLRNWLLYYAPDKVIKALSELDQTITLAMLGH